MLGVELEVIAKKTDRFGWDRDRGTASHDRLVMDWMEALQDYPLAEVQAACRQWVLGPNRKRTPHEGDIIELILSARRREIEAFKAPDPTPEPERQRISPERAQEILSEVGFSPRRFGGTEASQ